MTQRIPADARLGRTNAGQAIGYRILNLDGSLFSSWRAAQETTIPGHYVAVGGTLAPDAGGYIVWGLDGEDLAEASIEPVQPDTTPAMERRVAVLLDALSDRMLRAIALIELPPVIEIEQPAEHMQQLADTVARLTEMAEAAKQMRQAVVIAEHLSSQLGQYAGTMAHVQEADIAQRRRLVAIDDFLRTVEEAVR